MHTATPHKTMHTALVWQAGKNLWTTETHTKNLSQKNISNHSNHLTAIIEIY